MGNVKTIGSIASGYVLEKPLLTRSAEGWDEVRELVRLSTGAAGINPGDSRSPSGITGTFFVQIVREVQCQIGQKVVEIISRGLAASKGYIAEPTSYTEAFDGVIAGVPAAPAIANVRVQIPRTGVNVRWLSTSEPDGDAIGTLVTPPETFGVPTYPITPAADNELYHYPYGWYLARRDPQRLPLTTYFIVSDSYIYQPSPTVRGG